MRPRFRLLAAAIAVSGLTLSASFARAELLIEIDKTTQRMTVTRDGAQLYVWPVSTGAPATTPRPAVTRPFAWRKITSRANGTTRRCPIPCSSPSRATPSMAASM